MPGTRARWGAGGRGWEKPRQPGSSAKSEPKTTKYKPPGPENDGKIIQCEGATPRRKALNASARKRRMIGPISAIAYQTRPTRQVLTWRETERIPPVPG